MALWSDAYNPRELHFLTNILPHEFILGVIKFSEINKVVVKENIETLVREKIIPYVLFHNWKRDKE